MAFTIERESLPKGWYTHKVVVTGANESEATSRMAAWLVAGHRYGVKVFCWRPYGNWEDPTPRYIEDTPMPAKAR